MPHSSDETFDAVLVGATAGALIAAIKLAEFGLRPLVLEKAAKVGGGTAYSGGIVWAPKNHRMVMKGVPDSFEEARRYLAQVSHGSGDPDQARVYVETVGAALLYVEACTSLKWATYRGLPDYWAEYEGGKLEGRFLLPLPWRPSSLGLHDGEVRGLLSLPGREGDWVWGRALIGALYETALFLEVPIRLNQRALGLVGHLRALRGVRVAREDGSEYDVYGRRGVLLNTGGFEWNEEWTSRWIKGPRPQPQTPPSNEGDGHAMLIKLGVPLDMMDRTIAIPGVLIPHGSNDGRELWRVFFQPLARPRSMVVNRAGRRFANESFFVELVQAMQFVNSDGLAPNNPAYFVWDNEYERRYGRPGEIPIEMVIEASSVEELASRCAIPPSALRDDVLKFNISVRSGSPDQFHRGSTAYSRAFGDPTSHINPTLGPVEEPPFRAVPIHVTTAGHRGGAIIDVHARVIGADGDPIPGLYACGNVVAGRLTGREYFSGVSTGHALVFGILAAEDMIKRHDTNR